MSGTAPAVPDILAKFTKKVKKDLTTHMKILYNNMRRNFTVVKTA